MVTTRAKVESWLYRIRAVRAGSLARLSQNEVEKNPQSIRNNNGHQRPKDRAHPAALRVAVDVSDEQQVTPCGNAGQQAQQWPGPYRGGVRATGNSDIEEPLRGNEYDPRQHPRPRGNDFDFRRQSSLSFVSYQHKFVRFLITEGARCRSPGAYPGPPTKRPPPAPERKRKTRSPLAKPGSRLQPIRPSMQTVATKAGWSGLQKDPRLGRQPPPATCVPAFRGASWHGSAPASAWLEPASHPRRGAMTADNAPRRRLLPHSDGTLRSPRGEPATTPVACPRDSHPRRSASAPHHVFPASCLCSLEQCHQQVESAIQSRLHRA